MARLFNLSLEETIAEADSAAEQAPQEEIDAIENSETAATTEAEIESSSSEVSEAMEETEALAEQVEVNDEVLASTAGSSDEAIEESQVVEAQESLKYAIATFGGRTSYVEQVRLSTENAAYASRRERLKVANEGAKEFIKKLIETAKRILKQIYLKVSTWIRNIMFKIANYGKAIDKVVAQVKKVKAENIRQDDVKEALIANGSYEAVNGLVTGKAVTYDFIKEPADFIKLGSNLKEMTPEKLINYVKHDYLKQPTWVLDGGEGKIVGATGKNALIIGDKGFKKVSLVLDKEPDAYRVKDLLTSITSNAANVKKGVGNASAAFKAFQKIQDMCYKEVENVKAPEDGDDGKKAAMQIELTKSISITACVFKMNEYVGAIKGFIAIGKAIVANSGSDS